MGSFLYNKAISKLLDTKEFPVTVLLVDDQLIIAEAVKRMLADESDIRFYYCNDPTDAIRIASEVKPTVILQDLVMPDIEGLTLVKYFRANPATHDVPLIVLSVKEDPQIKAEAFALGANDYVVKLPDKREFIARIRYHSTAYTRLLERNLAFAHLEESQRSLHKELNEASDYVRSLLPEPIDDVIKTSWQFIPSMLLGGDAFGYYWLDKDHFVMYLLDVCGHGVGAALLSISAINALRTQTLRNIDFLDPSEVLKALNRTFPMEKHNNMFFSIWYGIYDKTEKTLTYSSGGHPPALLFQADGNLVKLGTPGLVIGAVEETLFECETCKVNPGDRIYLFSDGVFELLKHDGTTRTFGEFTTILKRMVSNHVNPLLEAVVNEAYTTTNGRSFEDDYSIVEFLLKNN